MIDTNFLKTLAKDYNIEFSNYQVSQFEEYSDILVEYNKKVNLTSILEPRDIVIKHFIDSMMFLVKLDIKQNQKLIDIGTGAGFPGIVLKILRPDLKIYLVDSLLKKVNFLEIVVNSLDLKCIYPIHDRVEHLHVKEDYKQCFDIATCRAVGDMSKVCELAIPLVKIGGIFAPLRGRSAESDLFSAHEVYSSLGCEYINSFIYDLPEDAGKRSIILLKRIAENMTKPYKQVNFLSKLYNI